MKSTIVASVLAIGYLSIAFTCRAEDIKLPKSQTVINEDIDGNGKPDRIVASYFTRPVLVNDDRQSNTCKTVPGKFVRYTLYRDGQRQGQVIFEENYGSTRASYWVHELKVTQDFNDDGRKDLIFYMGDDTSDEKTYLLQKTAGFKAVYVGNYGLPSLKIGAQRELIDFKNKVIAKWDRDTERWRGDRIGWVSGDCVAIRERPSASANIISLGFDRTILVTLDRQQSGDWIAVALDGSKVGWINKKYFSPFSPSHWFR